MPIHITRKLTVSPDVARPPSGCTLQLRVRGIGAARAIKIRYSIADRWNVGLERGGVVVSAFEIAGLTASDVGDGTDFSHDVTLARRPEGASPQNIVITAVVTDVGDGSRSQKTARVEILA